MNKIELLPIKKEQVMIPQDSTTGFQYKTVRLQNVWADVEDKINEIASALNVFIEERNAPNNAIAKDLELNIIGVEKKEGFVNLRIPTADEVCKMLSKELEEKVEYDSKEKEFVCGRDSYFSITENIMGEEYKINDYVSPKTLLAIALFYAYGEGKR